MTDSKFTLEFDYRGHRYATAEQGLREFAKRTGRAPESLVASMTGSIRWYLDNVAKAMGKRHRTPWPGGTTDKTLSKRSGTLAKAITDSVKVEGSELASLRGSIGANVVYARIQEFGGTIVPKTSKYLAIPLPSALDSRGVPLKVGPRAWQNTFVAKSKAGNLIIFQKRGTQVIPLYVLKTKVTIPPRLGLGDTIRTGMGLFVDRSMSDMLKALKQAL